MPLMAMVRAQRARAFKRRAEFVAGDGQPFAPALDEDHRRGGRRQGAWNGIRRYRTFSMPE